MKKFITNYWKKILILIGGVFILINSFKKIFAEKGLLSDYIKYGKNIEKTTSPITSGDISDVVSVPEMPFNSGIIKLGIILMVLILLIVFITSLADRAGAKDKKK